MAPKAETDAGVALNAAVILDDPRRIAETMPLLVDAAAKAGMKVKAVTWLEASGIVGQSMGLLRMVLYLAVLIIFAVALVIINNAMVMATLQRVKEIGTMRAIGAQRRFVLVLVVAPVRAPILSVFAHAGAFVASGALATYLAEQLRRTGERLEARESDLAAVTALQEAIVQSVASGLLTLDAADRITFLNRAGEQITGLPADRVVGRRLAEVAPVFAELSRRDAGPGCVPGRPVPVPPGPIILKS